MTVTKVSYDGEPEVTVETECSGEDIVLMTDRYIERIITEYAPLAVQDDFHYSDGSKGLSQYIKRFQNHPDFPLLRRDFNKIGFTNGIFDSIQQVFISFNSPSYNGEWETILPAKCYPIPFKDEMNTDSAHTPLWDSIYKNQFPDELDEEGNYKELPYEDFVKQKYPTQVYIEAHLGRCLYPVLKKVLKGNDTVAVPYQDNKQGFMILRGQPGTGKTVLFRCVSMMLPMDAVGKLDTSVQDNFMMEEWPNKHLIIAYDMPDGKSAKGKNFFQKQFTGKLFNDLADRNMVVVNRKGLKNTSEYIPACLLFGTNDSYGWSDGGTSRRIHQFFFHNVIPDEVKDANLENKIVNEELAIVQLRLIRNYRKIFLDEFKDLVFDTFPVRMLQPPPIQKKEILTKVKETVYNCLNERFEYRPGAITFYEEFRDALKEFVEASTFSQYPDRGGFLTKEDVQDYVQMVAYYRDSNGNNFSKSLSLLQGMCPICSSPDFTQAEGEEQQNGVDRPQNYYPRFFLMSGCNKLKLHKGDSKAKAISRRVLNERGSKSTSQYTEYDIYFINMVPKEVVKEERRTNVNLFSTPV